MAVDKDLKKENKVNEQTFDTLNESNVVEVFERMFGVQSDLTMVLLSWGGGCKLSRARAQGGCCPRKNSKRRLCVKKKKLTAVKTCCRKLKIFNLGPIVINNIARLMPLKQKIHLEQLFDLKKKRIK